MLGFVWIVVVVVGIWVYDWRRQERLMWEARIRAAVDEAIAQMAARHAALTPPVSPPPAPAEAAAPVSPKPAKPPPPPLKPATADTCPHCRANALVESSSPVQPTTPVNPPVDRWADSVESARRGRGRPKTIDTHGFACPNPECDFYNQPDSRKHKLIGHGRHGKHERIQDLLCNACNHKFSVRRNTALFRLHTPTQNIEQSLYCVLEGMSFEAVSGLPYVKPSIPTLQRWIHGAALHAEALHHELLCQQRLTPSQLQLDELKTRVRQAPDDQTWIWTGLCATHKLWLVLTVGPRTQLLAHAGMHQLRDCLLPGYVPLFFSDGLKSYYYALTAHWGSWQLDESNKRYWLLSPDLRYALLSAVEGLSNPTNAASSIASILLPRLAPCPTSPSASLMLGSQVP